MTYRPVHWHEGMFLRPQHFQTAQRHWFHLVNQSEKWDQHYNWGIRVAELDLDALANYRIVIRSLRVRLRDGTLVAIPEDGMLQAPDLKAAFVTENNITVYLGVPVLNLGKANIGSNGSADGGARFLLDTQSLEDENTGLNPQPVQVRLLNARLLLSTQDLAGYETLPIARIVKSATADGTPQLDQTYIPPVLACDAWAPLAGDIMQAVYDRVGKKLELLSNQVVTRGMTFDSMGQGDRRTIEQVRVLNEAYSSLGVLAFAQGVHPLVSYTELCRIVGQLSIFGATHRTPDLPRYDHDDLGACFYQVKKHIDALLDVVEEPVYKERPFIGAGLRMQVTIESVWLESTWSMFVGVQSPLSGEECIRLLTRAGQGGQRGLDMKIGSSDRVDEIFRLGQSGLRFTHNPRPPRALPSIPGLVYFEVNRQSQPEEWAHVQKSLTMAIRLNENLIAGNIQGQRVLTIKTGGQTTTMQFTLYVMPREK